MQIIAIRGAGTRRACCDFRVVIPATFDAIEQLFAEFRQQCECIRQHHDCFAAELLLREALTNAVVHGNQSNPARSVGCALRMKGSRLIIAVEDQGAGFDWHAARIRQAEASACSGRGMEIFRKYATRVRFNQKGNRVTIVKVLGQGKEVGERFDGSLNPGG
jgi:serine/threonine-protein kinase RsbW